MCFGESLPGFICRPLHLHPGKIRPAERNWLKPPLAVPAGRPAASVTTPAVPTQPAAAVPVRQHNLSEEPLEITAFSCCYTNTRHKIESQRALISSLSLIFQHAFKVLPAFLPWQIILVVDGEVLPQVCQGSPVESWPSSV